jgi:hypothetical protein
MKFGTGKKSLKKIQIRLQLKKYLELYVNTYKYFSYM